jgi:hypothetical protein
MSKKPTSILTGFTFDETDDRLSSNLSSSLMKPIELSFFRVLLGCLYSFCSWVLNVFNSFYEMRDSSPDEMET